MHDTTQRPAEASGMFAIGGDLPVYRLGFGAMRITGEGVWGPPANKQEAIAVLRRALELGINLIDTADSYGPGELARQGGQLDQIARRHHATPSQIAIAWLLQRSSIMLPIPGTSSVKHLEENVLGATIKLTHEEFAALDRSSIS